MVVETGNFQQLHDAIHTMITDTALADSLSKAGLQTARDRSSRENVAEKYIDVFESVQGGGK